VVTKASLDRMTTAFKNDYAFGLISATTNGRRVIWHNGGIDGFNTYMAFYPDTHSAVIVLSNVNGPVPDQLGAQLGALAHGDKVTLPTERREITVAPETLAKYVGEYAMTPAVTMTIAMERDHLTAQLTGQGKNPIFPQSATLFFLKVVDAQIEFAPDGASLVLHQGGRDIKATRR
jgi:hypothetical protein